MDINVLKEMLRMDPFLVRRLLEEASIGPKEMMALALNWIDEPKERFWCPGCEKAQSHPEIVAPWISSKGRLVCFYLLCRRCVKSTIGASDTGNRELTQRKADLIERILIKCYPHIAENLPAGYFDGSSSEVPEDTPELVGHLLIPNPIEPRADDRTPMQVSYRKYLVIRFLSLAEIADVKKQVSLVWHLGERYPLVSVCHNGEEPDGLEAWFKVEGWSEAQCRSLMDYACMLGADPETFDPLCLVHLPGAINPATGKKQKLIYLDPEGKNFPDGPTPLAGQRPA
jgi:hypothetical protein